MSIDASVTDFLNSGGGKSAKFENVGDSLVGSIIAARTQQQTDIDGTPKFWDNGDPRTELVVTLATDQRDPADPQDDGARNLYLKGSKKDPLTSAGALVAALRDAGANTLELGGKLGVQFVGFGAPAKPGLSAPKQWRMQYKAPALVAGADLFGDTAAPAAPPASPAPAPQVAAAPAPAAPAAPAAADPFEAF